MTPIAGSILALRKLVNTMVGGRFYNATVPQFDWQEKLWSLRICENDRLDAQNRDSHRSENTSS